MPVSFLPVIAQTAPAPISPVQLLLLGCQVLIAVVTIYISKRYYDGMTKRGAESLELQRGSLQLQLKADFQKVEELINGICDAAISAAKSGVEFPQNPKNAIKLLRDVRRRISDLESSVRGVSSYWDSLQAFQVLLGAYINSDKEDDPYDYRLTLYGDINRSGEELKKQWKKETLAQLKKMEPKL